MKTFPKRWAAVAIPLALIGCGPVDDTSLTSSLTELEPPPEKALVARSETRNVFWGDLHIHTSLSFDAYTMGVRVLPDDAYTHMKGGTIEHGAGYKVRNRRPLDFGAVTDHASYLGGPRHRAGADANGTVLPEILATGNPFKISWHWFSTLDGTMEPADWATVFSDDKAVEASTNAWQSIIDAAERHNDPGRFTAFVGYEWTSMPDGQNLHRNVIYKGNQVPDFPFSAIDSENPEDLWVALEEQRAQGMNNFSIPHNGNISNGLMYDTEMFDGGEFSADYAKRRMINEPISEMLQIKGSSETHPDLSPNDPFAGYELYTTLLRMDGADSKNKGSYVRDALRTGLEMQNAEGYNPYQFGFIGSSDSHNGTAAVEEDNYQGKLPLMDGSAGLRSGEVLLLPAEYRRAEKWSAQGLAAVWAQENTRDSLFEAMQRKETYATSGPRMTLRMFAGWDYPEQLLEKGDWLNEAYANGVPMGGELVPSEASTGGAPTLVIVATKDPLGANLDRLQVVKAWVDASGKSFEKIFDVAGSGDRVIDPATGLLASVGNTVDVKTATYDNSIGGTELSAMWTDPEFEAGQQAFYYARVLEIPTPRYSTFDAIALGIEAPEPSSIQERAISSAIWYKP